LIVLSVLFMLLIISLIIRLRVEGLVSCA
jgi:hypothetical protein